MSVLSALRFSYDYLKNQVLYKLKWHSNQYHSYRQVYQQWEHCLIKMSVTLRIGGEKNFNTWIARKAAMHIQFPNKHRTPRCQLSNPRSIKLDINHPTGSGWPLALISLWTRNSDSLLPNTAGPRNKAIKIAPETQTRVPPTLAWPSVLNKFTVSVLNKQPYMRYWTDNNHMLNMELKK